MTNTRNFSQKSNFMCGSEALALLPFYAQSISLPGITFNVPEVGGRGGYKINATSDTATFSSLSVDLILDEDMLLYKEIMKVVFDHINLKTGTYADFSFSFWIQQTDDMGIPIIKWEFTNCRIESVGQISFETTSDETENIMTLDLKFDYYEIIETPPVPTLRV